MRLVSPTGKQLLALQDCQNPNVRIHLWTGSVRSGKTINSLLAWANFIATGPPGPLLMAGRTFDTLRRNALDPLIQLLGADNVAYKGGIGKAQILGKQVHLIGADNNASESRIRGLTLAGSYVDELTILGGQSGETWFNQLLSRHSIKGAKVFATTNPDHPNHWLLQRFIKNATVEIRNNNPIKVVKKTPRQNIGLHHYHFTLEDNTTLPSEYVNSLKASLTGVFYDRFILGEWVAAEGSIFPELTPDTKPPPATLHTHTVGVDVGTTNPTHAVLIGLDENQHLWVIDEFVNKDPNLTIGEQVAHMLTWLEGHPTPTPATIVVDPSAKAFRNEWHRQTRSWPWQADNKVLSGIADVGTLLKRERIHLTPARTPVLYGELQGYRWDTKATLKGTDAPVKQDDHGPDALRYAIRALKKHWEPTVTTHLQPPTEPFTPPWMRQVG